MCVCVCVCGGGGGGGGEVAGIKLKSTPPGLVISYNNKWKRINIIFKISI